MIYFYCYFASTFFAWLALSARASSSLIEYINYEESAELGYKILTYAVMKVLDHENWCYFFYQLVTVGGFYIGAYKHRKTVSPYIPYVALVAGALYWFIQHNTSMHGSLNNFHEH